MRLIIHLLLSGLAVFVSARMLPGVHVDSYKTALIAAVALGLVNMTIRPMLILLTLPLTIVTLGLWTLVIIGACVMLVARLVPGFQVLSFWWALAFAGVLWVINGFFHLIEPR